MAVTKYSKISFFSNIFCLYYLSCTDEREWMEYAELFIGLLLVVEFIIGLVAFDGGGDCCPPPLVEPVVAILLSSKAGCGELCPLLLAYPALVWPLLLPFLFGGGGGGSTSDISKCRIY
jgi:hypothetical protein